MLDILIREGKPDDLPFIQQISDAELGIGYFNTFNQKLFMKNNMLRVLMYHEQLVGFCYSYITKYDEIESKWKISDNKPHLSLNPIVGILQTVAVKEGFKKKGLGNKLINDAIECLSQQNVSAIYTTIWDKPDTDSNRRLMIKNGFRWQKSIPHYWTSDSIKKEYSCPVCGHPCRCSASIYQKSI